MKPGVYPPITGREYFAEPCPRPALTCSTIKTLLYRTAAEAAYEHPAITPDSEAAKSTAAKRFGDVAHQLALGRGRGYAIGEYDAWQSKEAKAFRDAAIANGLTPIKRKEFDAAETSAKVMKAKIERTLGAIAGGNCPDYETEVVFAWQEKTKAGLIWCRGMADVWCESLGVILDPKFSPVISDGAFEAHAVSMGWDVQDAWYRRGIGKLLPDLAGRLRFINLVVSPKPPNISRAREADEATRYSCELLINMAIERFGSCLYANDWPGYPDSIEPWTAKSWTLSERSARAATEEEN